MSVTLRTNGSPRRMASNNRLDVPIVMIHGLFGWGEKRPLFGMFPSYFPLGGLRSTWRSGPVVAIDVGVGSSDHDRACEAFAQLFGVRTDYGEAHAAACGHERFGPDYSGEASLQRWGAAHPVHLVGHSFGGNTALTLFRLLVDDFWAIGTNGEWIASITTICSPMRGASLPCAMGLSEPDEPGQSPIRPWSFTFWLCLVASPVFYVQLFCPWFDGVYGFRMKQWRTQTHFRDWLFGRNPYWTSGDNMLSESTPKCCRDRLCIGLEHLAKLHLIAVVGDSVEPMSPTGAVVRAAVFAALIAPLVMAYRKLRKTVYWRRVHALTKSVIALMLLLPVLCLRIPAARKRLVDTLRAMIHSSIIHPFMRLSSHFVRGGAAALPSGTWIEVDGGDVACNDGIIDVVSQTGLDIPLVRSSNRWLSAATQKTAGSSNHLAAMAKTGPRALAMSRTYSDVVLGDSVGPASLQRPEKGKWHIIRVPNGNHSLGTNFSVHSSAMYDTVLGFLDQIR